MVLLRRSLCFIVLFAAICGFSSLSAKADDAIAEGLYQQAIERYGQREDTAKVEEALALLDLALLEQPNAELAYSINILGSRIYFWKGKHGRTDAEKMDLFDKAMQKANAAKQLNDEYADAYYWYALNLGKWCLAKGVLASLTRKKELMSSAEAAIDRTAQNGQDGATIDYYGPNRILGHMYYKLPGFAGGSHQRAIKYLSESFLKAPTYVLNITYYAEALNDGNLSEKTKARQILDELLAKDPLTLNPDRIPETIEEFEEARQLRHDLGN